MIICDSRSAKQIWMKDGGHSRGLFHFGNANDMCVFFFDSLGRPRWNAALPGEVIVQ